MRFLGVDLAWGGRRPSGLAVLDPDGRVVDEGWATSDDALSAFLAAHDAGGAVVAVDAPLVVTNPAGTRRACEAELQRRWGRDRIRPTWGCSGGGCGRWSWSGGRLGSI